MGWYEGPQCLEHPGPRHNITEEPGTGGSRTDHSEPPMSSKREARKQRAEEQKEAQERKRRQRTVRSRVIIAAGAIALLAVAFLALRKDDAVAGGRVWSAAHGHYHDR